MFFYNITKLKNIIKQKIVSKKMDKGLLKLGKKLF